MVARVIQTEPSIFPGESNGCADNAGTNSAAATSKFIVVRFICLSPLNWFSLSDAIQKPSFDTRLLICSARKLRLLSEAWKQKHGRARTGTYVEESMFCTPFDVS